MNTTRIRLSEFTQDRLKKIARRKGLSVSQLINEISLRYTRSPCATSGQRKRRR